MTDQYRTDDAKPKRTRGRPPLRAGVVLDRIRALLADQQDRIDEARAAVVTNDAEKVVALVDRVVDARELAELHKMATALGVFLPAPHEPLEASEPYLDTRTASAGNVPSEPPPRGTAPYSPGPVAQALRGVR